MVKGSIGASQVASRWKSASSTVRAARRRGLVGGVAVERVLADVEVERRQVDRAELEQRAGTPAGSRRPRSPRAPSRSSSASRCSTQRSSSGISAGATRSASSKPVERAEQEAQRVAQPAVAVGGALQDLRPDALVDGVVGLRHPEPQDVGAVLLHHVLGRGGVAERLRHLHAVLVEREAVGQHRRRRARGPRVPQACSSEDWNQPRCWSVPSR